VRNKPVKFISALSAVCSLLLIFVFFLSSGVHASQATGSARGDTRLCKPSAILYTPETTPDGKYSVGIGIQPIRITNVSPSESVALVDFYLTIEYRLAAEHPDVKCVGHLGDTVWQRFYNPDIEMLSMHNPEAVQGHHWMVEDGRFAYMTRVKGNAEINGNFRLFPFDTIEIPITVGGEDSSKYLDLVPSHWYHEASSVEEITLPLDGINLPGWRVNSAHYTEVNTEWVSDAGEYWDELGIVVSVKREPNTKIARGLLPLLILFCVTFGSYSLRDSKELPSGRDRLVDTRIHIQVGTLLALFAYTLYLMELIPETSYLTLGDLTWTTFMLAIGLILLSEYLPNVVLIKNWMLSVKTAALWLAAVLVSALTLTYAVLYTLHG